MKIFWIIIKEFKQRMRDYKSNALMILLPIVLIVLLGAAFSSQFDNSFTLKDEKVLYKVDVTENTQFTTALDSFFSALSEKTGIVFEQADDVEAAKSDTENHTYSALVHVTENPLQINLYKNERAGFSTTLMENALNGFIKSYDAMAVIAGINPAAFSKPEFQGQNAHVRVSSLDKKQQPGSTDYYAITMLTLVLLYSSMTGFWCIRGEIELKTASRILCSPIHNYEVLAAKVIGNIFVTIVQGFVVVLFSKWVLNANWGQDLISVALIILSYAVMAVSLGVSLAFMIRNSEAASGILNTLIPVLVFFGGGYVPLSVISETFSKIGMASPVYWINTALFKVIYDNDYSGMIVSLFINIGLATLFITISALFSKRGDRAYA